MNDYTMDVVNYLVKNFFNGYLNFSLENAEVQKFDIIEQEKFLKATVQSDLLLKYPTSVNFGKLFFKKIINYLETNHEIHDDFYTFLCNTMSNDIGSEKYCYRHYIINDSLNEIITMKETKNMVVNGTTGMKTWEASLMLADFILSNKFIFRNRNILELGSGIGFTGITLSKYCEPKTIQMTDCHEDVLKGICENVEINFPISLNENIDDCITYKLKQTSIGVMPLDWNNIKQLPDNIIPDIVIGADIVYDPSILDALCSTIKYFFDKNKRVVVYVASIIRNEMTYKSFLKTLSTHSLQSTEVSYDCSHHLQWDTNIAKSLIKINLK